MHAEEAVRIAEEVDHIGSLIWAQFGLGWLLLHQGEVHQAITVLERALEHSNAANIPIWIPPITILLIYASALSGRVDEALRLLEHEASRRGSDGRVLSMRSEAHLLAGRLEDASVHARHALDLTGTQKNRGGQAWTLRLLGEIAAHREPPDVNITSFGRTIVLCKLSALSYELSAFCRAHVVHRFS